MIFGPSLERYIPEIRDAVLDYAYANYHVEPIIEQIDITDWVGEIFNVSNIDKELHEDLIEDLKELELYDKIVKTCDKFVILPDVWSESQIPITGPLYPRNQYDSDRRNIVIINDKVFELKDIKMKSIWYAHNKLLYCFYNDAKSGGMFNTPPGKKPSMSTIWLYDYGFTITNIKGNEDKWNIPQGDEWFKFCIDENNRLTEEDVDRVGLAINSHYIEFDYSNSVDPRIQVHIPGMDSNTSKDVWIRPKWYNMEDENRVYIHNKHVLFSNTAIVIYKDNSYNIENTYSVETDEVLTKIDKHTIRLEKDDSISKIIVFVRPYDPDKYPPADSLYYKATDQNMYAANKLKNYKKYTNDLYMYLTSHIGLDMNWLINWGYKYDLDVLKVIQNFFKTLHVLNPLTDMVVDYNDPTYQKPKIHIQVRNKLQLYPLLFINHKLYMADYKILKRDDADILVLDPEQMFKLCDTKGVINSKETIIDNSITGYTIPDYVPPSPTKDNYKDIPWIKDGIKKVVQDVRVFFVPFYLLSEASRQGGRIFRSPIYRGELIFDELGDPSLDNLFNGWQFVNGCMSNERFSKTLFRRLDGINLFDTGDLNFTVTAKKSPTDKEVYNIDKIQTRAGELNYFVQDMSIIPNDIEIGESSIVKLLINDPESAKYKDSIYNGQEMTLLINRLDEKIKGVCKVGMTGYHIPHVCNFNYADTMYPVDSSGHLKEFSTIAFDKYGIECTDNVDILSSQYASCDNMYNYVANPELEDEIVVHYHPNRLQDYIREYDLEIDENRINRNFNKGMYNDNALEDEQVKALFIPNEPSEIRPIPITKKTNYRLLGEKILTRYWLGGRGRVFDKDRYRAEVSGLNGAYVKPDGTLGTVPAEFNDFVKSDKLRGDTPLIDYQIGQDLVYNMFVNAGINYISFNDNYVDSNREYPVEISNTYDAHTDKNRLTINMNNDMFIHKK